MHVVQVWTVFILRLGSEIGTSALAVNYTWARYIYYLVSGQTVFN